MDSQKKIPFQELNEEILFQIVKRDLCICHMISSFIVDY